MKRLVARHKITFALATLGAASFSASTALAAGYAFFEQGAAATGRAGAVVASSVDASMGFYNPAGLADLDGFNLMLGGTLVLNFGGYESSLGSYDRTLRGTFPPNLHAYYSSKGKWSAGVSIYNAWGLGVDWPSNFPGSYLADRIDLKTPTIQPTFAYRPHPMFSFGVGVAITVASAELIRSVPIAPFPAGNVFLGADKTMGIGAVAGIQVTPMKRLRFGVNYRSAMKLAFDNGKADFTFDSSIPAAIRAGLPSDQGGSLELTTPHVLSMGVAYDVTDRFTVELNVNHYWWSVFEELRLKFGPPPTGGQPVPGNCTPSGVTAGVSHVCSKREWMDVPQFRLGVDWRATDKLNIRGGYIFDLTPVPSNNVDPVLPDANRHDFSLGIGYQFLPSFRIDAAYLLVYFTERKAPAALVPLETGPGKYNTIAHLFSLNLGFHF